MHMHINAPYSVWRHSANPVIGRNPAKNIARIFNSAVIALDGKFVGVFRAETVNGRPHLQMGWSEDGLDWKIAEEPIAFVDEDGQPYEPRYAYDPRLVKVDYSYYIIWCTDFNGAAIGMACYSLGRSMAISPCSHVLVTVGIHLSVIYS